MTSKEAMELYEEIEKNEKILSAADAFRIQMIVAVAEFINDFSSDPLTLGKIPDFEYARNELKKILS